MRDSQCISGGCYAGSTEGTVTGMYCSHSCTYFIPCCHSYFEKTIESGCGGTGNADLSQCRNSCYSAGRETAWTGVCDLFQCFYCHTVDSALDTL